MDSSLEFNPSCFDSSQIWSSQISSVLPLVGEDDSDVTAGLMQFGDLLDAEFPHLDKIGIGDRDNNFHPFFVGQGTSYKVYASRFTKWDRVVAVKYARVAVRPHSISESQEIVIPHTRQKLTAILQEIYTICWFGYHPNIISLLGWSHEFDDGELTAHLIVEFSSRGSLRRFLQAQNCLDMSICEKFCVDVVRGLSALHEHGVVQGDLKLENILVFEDSDGAPAARISDFGFAIFMEPNKKTYLYHGTSLYNAPEVATQIIRPIPLDELPACDIYSYGLMVWEIFQQGIPYKSECSCNEISSQEAVWSLESTSANGNLELAIRFVEKLVDADLREILALVFEATLPPKPLQRKSARNVLSLFRGGDHLAGEVETPLQIAPNQLQQRLVPRGPQRDLHNVYYHKYSWETQMDLLRRLEFSASNPNHPRRIEYLLELCEFYAIGIGTSPSQELRITCLKKAKLYGSRYAAAVLKSLGQSSEDLQDQDTVPRGAAMRQENPFLDYTRSLQSDNILYNLEVQKIEEMALGGWYPDQIEKFLVDTAHNKKLSRSFTVSFKRSHEDSKQLQIPLLHYAAFRNDLRVMQLALDYGLNVDTVDASSGQTALICALSYGQYEAAKLLLINGANASKAAYSGLNPFHCLCLVPDEYLVTLAHYALRLGDTQGLLSSVCHDEYLYMLSFSGTPLDYAAMIGNLNAVKIMLGGAQEIYKSRPKVLEDAIEMAARNLYADICQSIGGIDTTLSGHPLHVLGLTSVHSLDLRHGLNKATALNSTIKTLQALGYSINAKATGTGWENGMTPLSFAVISNPGCPDIVCALIEHGADTEALNEDGSTALLCAIFAAENSRNEGYVSLLLARGASAVRTTQCNDAGSPRFRGVDSQPLHRACEANAQGAVQCLLAESNIDINARDGYGQTPLHIACGRNRIPLIRLLMDANAEINTIDNEGCSPLEEAVRKGCSATAIYLLDLGVSVFNIASPTRRSILMYALSFYVTRAQSEACLNLLRHEHIRQQDVLDWADETGHTAIGKAILTGQYAAAHELLKLGVPIHHPPLRASIYPAGISPLLLMIGSNVTLDFLGHLEDYEKLLHTMVDMVHLGGGLEAREITGSTALHYACKMTNLVAVQILLTKGADTKATKILGQTPLHSAIRGVVKKLRRKPDDEDSLDGPTANEEQLEDRLIQIIDLLLVHGAEIDAADDFGYTTLHDAIMAPDFSAEMAQLLLQKGASVSQKTHQGETPLHMVIIGNKYRRDTYEPFFGARSDWPIPDNGSERARILIKDLIRNKASLECLPGEDYNILDKAILNNRLSEARCLADLGVRSSIGTEKILDWQIAEQHRPSESAQQRRPRRLSL